MFHIHERLCDAHHLDELVAQLDAVLSVPERQRQTFALRISSSVKTSTHKIAYFVKLSDYFCNIWNIYNLYHAIISPVLDRLNDPADVDQAVHGITQLEADLGEQVLQLKFRGKSSLLCV